METLHRAPTNRSQDTRAAGMTPIRPQVDTQGAASKERSAQPVPAFEARVLAAYTATRLGVLAFFALLGCVAVWAAATWLTQQIHFDAQWQAHASGRLELGTSTDPALQRHVGETLVSVSAPPGSAEPQSVSLDAAVLVPSSRWLVDDATRQHRRNLHQQLAQVASTGAVVLKFASGSEVYLQSSRLSLGSLPGMFWVLCALALVLYLVGVAVLLASPSAHNLGYALVCSFQATNLVLLAAEAASRLGIPWALLGFEFPVRAGLDLLSAAAIVNAASLNPRRLPSTALISAAAWGSAALLITLMALEWLPNAWWWTQGSVALMLLAAAGLLTWSHRIEPHPIALVLRRFNVVTAVTWLLLTAAIAGVSLMPPDTQNIAATGSTIWYVYFASMLMLSPFLSPSQLVTREFTMMAAFSTAAASIYMIFVAHLPLGSFAALTLTMLVSLAAYAGARQWVVTQLLNEGTLSSEQIFEQIYRIAREVEGHPERLSELLSQFIRALFEPLELRMIDGHTPSAQVVAQGSTLLLPVPSLTDDSSERPQSIVIRFAHRGRWVFSQADANLVDRITEQLRRAVAFDKAVEQGRSEERVRLAQDLHDDIGARLLTIIYKSPSPEMEDYARHTLKDLKTLTRGLTATQHLLSHAAAEWKSDLTQRLNAAGIKLEWTLECDTDPVLSVGQWSALTRVLRELISNVMSHAQAQHVQIVVHLERHRLELTVTDDGRGRNPQGWTHGLGLGGVRKRVKQLGGEVDWQEVPAGGIVCHVRVAELNSP